jgi:hypothetical protein
LPAAWQYLDNGKEVRSRGALALRQAGGACGTGDGAVLDKTDDAKMQRLLKRIKDRRRTVDAYLRTARPRAARLTYVSITSSALAAALTAGPGLGGAKFTKGASSSLGLDSAPAVWQPLCLLAFVVSVIAAISANLSKSKNAEARIIHAEACNAELEGLQALVEFQQVTLEDAVKLYQQYVARIPFVAEKVPSKKRSVPSQQ